MEDAVMLRLIQLELENWENPRTLLICLATLSVFLISTGQYYGVTDPYGLPYTTIEVYITTLRDLMLFILPLLAGLTGADIIARDRTYQLLPLLFCRELTPTDYVSSKIFASILLQIIIIFSIEGVLFVFCFILYGHGPSNGVYGRLEQAFSIAHPWIFIFLVSLGYVLAGIFFTGIGLLAGAFTANRWVCTLSPFTICFLAIFALQNDTSIIFSPAVYLMLDGVESISWLQYFSYLITQLSDQKNRLKSPKKP
jgi:ABC-type transport system involved in multi-copper enzyme maturation permease subunit